MTRQKPRIDKFGQVRPPRRQVPVRLLITVIILLAVSLGAYALFQQFVSSVEQFEPPATPEIEVARGTTAIAERAVLIIVSGLRSEAAREMPALEDLRQRGAQAEARVPWPTTPEDAWATLLSGARPGLSGAVKLDSTEPPRPIAVDHLLRRARVSRRTTGLAGHEHWQSMIQTSGLTEEVVSTDTTSDGDTRLIRQIVDMLAARPPGLMVIQLSQVHTAGQIYGDTSDEYYRAAQRADELIRRLTSVIDLSSTALVVTSDLARGEPVTATSPEPVAVSVPLILAGAGVQPGSYGLIDQTDVVPTVAGLLGLPIPAQSQGRVRFEMLDMSPVQQADKTMALAGQQIRLSDAYLRAIDQGGTSGEAAQTLSVARTAWDIGNVEGASEIGRQSEATARYEMANGRSTRIAQERSERLPIAVGVGAVLVIGLLWLLDLQKAWLLGAGLLAWLGPLGQAGAVATNLEMPALRWTPAVVGAGLALAAIIWTRRSGRRELAIVAGLAVAVGLLFAYLQSGAPFSAVLANPSAFRTTMIWRSVAALLLGAGAVVTLLWSTEPSLDHIARASYWFVALLTVLLLIDLAVGYWLLGLAITWHLPDLGLVDWHLTNLTQTMLVASFGILLPAAVFATLLILRRARRRLTVRSPAQTASVGELHP